MTEVTRSVLVPYTPEQMFALVDDVTAYPEFVPWCSGAEEHRRDEHGVDATLSMSWGMLRQSFTTRNTRVPPQRIDMTLVRGPFRSLDGRWTFAALGDEGCKVELHVNFAFSGSAFDSLLSSGFQGLLSSLVDAFAARAAKIYGPA